jgi:hypothetical protein
MIDIELLVEHSKSFTKRLKYDYKIVQIQKLCSVIEKNGHNVDYLLLSLKDGPSLDITCRSCGMWSVYTELRNFDVKAILQKSKSGLTKDRCNKILGFTNDKNSRKGC